jgi:hypothetical protein
MQPFFDFAGDPEYIADLEHHDELQHIGEVL